VLIEYLVAEPSERRLYIRWKPVSFLYVNISLWRGGRGGLFVGGMTRREEGKEGVNRFRLMIFISKSIEGDIFLGGIYRRRRQFGCQIL
jgi:hypothetical protein